MKIHSSDEIAAAINALAVEHGQDGIAAALRLPDFDYVCMTRESVRFFGQRFMDFLKNSGLKDYTEETNDCDEYALHAASFAKIDHARFYKGEAGLAFGLAYIFTDTLAHAVNVAVHTEADGKLALAIYEPQVTWNDKQNPIQPYMTMREFPLSSVRRWQLLLL